MGVFVHSRGVGVPAPLGFVDGPANLGAVGVPLRLGGADVLFHLSDVGVPSCSP